MESPEGATGSSPAQAAQQQETPPADAEAELGKPEEQLQDQAATSEPKPALPKPVSRVPQAKPGASQSSNPNSPEQASDSPAGSSSPSNGAGNEAGSFSVGEARGDLSASVTRLLPLAALAHPHWGSLPTESHEQLVLKLSVGDEGRLISLDADPKAGTAPHLARIERALWFRLKSLRFTSKSGTTGAFVSRVEVKVSRASGDTASLEADGVDLLAAEYPKRNEPGIAKVRYRSGLELRFEVRSLDE